MSFRVKEIQPTPNPNAVKMILDRPIAPQPMSFFNAGAAAGNELATKLFAVQGVSSLLMLGDFITVNKTLDADWKSVTSGVKAVLEQATD